VEAEFSFFSKIFSIFFAGYQNYVLAKPSPRAGFAPKQKRALAWSA